MDSGIPPPPGLNDYYSEPPAPPGMSLPPKPSINTSNPMNSLPGLLPFPSNLVPQAAEPLPPGMAPGSLAPISTQMSPSPQRQPSPRPTPAFPAQQKPMPTQFSNSVLNAPGLMGPSPALINSTPMSKDENVRRCVHLGNLDSKCPQTQIVSFFGGRSGPLSFIRMAGDENQATRFAFIEFMDEIGAIRATELAGEPFGDGKLKVKPSTTAIVKPTVHIKEDDQARISHRLKKLTKKILKIQFPKKRKRSLSRSEDEEEREEEIPQEQQEEEDQEEGEEREKRRRFKERQQRHRQEQQNEENEENNNGNDEKQIEGEALNSEEDEEKERQNKHKKRKTERSSSSSSGHHHSSRHHHRKHSSKPQSDSESDKE